MSIQSIAQRLLKSRQLLQIEIELTPPSITPSIDDLPSPPLHPYSIIWSMVEYDASKWH